MDFDLNILLLFFLQKYQSIAFIIENGWTLWNFKTFNYQANNLATDLMRPICKQN